MTYCGVFLFLLACQWQAYPASAASESVSSQRSLTFVLENHDDVGATQSWYAVTAAIGSPPQSLTLLLDTNYGYLRVDEQQCVDCVSENRFASQKSKSFRQERLVTFGKSPAVLGWDLVSFGSFQTNQTLVAMKRTTKKDYRGFDGVLGLGFEHPDKGDFNLLENLKRSGVIERAVFSLYLNVKGLRAAQQSSLTFGSWNLSRYAYDSAFTFMQVDLSGGRWTLPVTRTAIGDVVIDEKPRKAFISTSQDRLVVPKAVYSALWKHICSRVSCEYGDEPRWNCEQQPQELLSSVTLSIGGVTVVLRPHEYTFIPQKSCLFDFRTMEGFDDWILGTHFIAQHYTLFDAKNSRVGFATAKQQLSEEYVWWKDFFFYCIVGAIAVLLALAFFFSLDHMCRTY